MEHSNSLRPSRHARYAAERILSNHLPQIADRKQQSAENAQTYYRILDSIEAEILRSYIDANSEK